MEIHQGDQFLIPFTIKRNNVVMTAKEVSSLEVIFAGIRKVYPGEIEFVGNEFMFPLKQCESLTLEEGVYDITVRPKYSDGTVLGNANAGKVTVKPVEGAEVI